MEDKFLNKKKVIGLSLYGVLFLALMLVLALVKLKDGTYLDFYITFKAYNPNFVVDFLERMGHCPTFVVPAIACAFISVYLLKEKKESKLWQTVAYLCIAVTYVGFLMTGHDLFKHFDSIVDTVWDTVVGWVLPAVLAVGSTFLLYYFSYKKIKKESIKKLAIWGFYALICVAASTVIVYILKYSWGRCRFRYMRNSLGGDYSQFTPWYKPNGFFKGENYYSFPSGHTYSASLVFTVPALFMLFRKQEKHFGEVFLICLFYTVLVAISRLIVGAHYMSDVTMGGTIGFVVCLVTKYLFFYKYNMKKYGEAEALSVEGCDGVEAKAEHSQEEDKAITDESAFADTENSELNADNDSSFIKESENSENN